MAAIGSFRGVSPLLQCSWGKLLLFASEVHTDSGRTQVVHELSSGDRHPVQNRGLRVRRVRCRLQFDNFPGQPAPADAALALERAKDTGEAAIFSHPLLGRFLASIGEFNQTIDDSSVISAECEFIKEDDDIAVTPSGAASSGTTGESSVTAAATAMDAQLAATGQLKMSGAAATALLSRTPGGQSVLSSLRARTTNTIDMTVGAAAAFATAIANQVASTANAIASKASDVAGAPVAVGFSAEGAVAAFNGLLSPFGQQIPSTPVPAPSGFGESDPSATLAAVATSEVAQGLYSSATIDARVSVANWSNGNVPTRKITIDAARISNNIAAMIEVGGFELDLALWPAFRAAIMLGEAVRSAAIAATSETPAVFVMRVVQSTALLPLAARIYGGVNALDRARQISDLNDISTPGWLTPGDYLMPVRPPAPAF